MFYVLFFSFLRTIWLCFLAFYLPSLSKFIEILEIAFRFLRSYTFVSSQCFICKFFSLFKFNQHLQHQNTRKFAWFLFMYTFLKLGTWFLHDCGGTPFECLVHYYISLHIDVYLLNWSQDSFKVCFVRCEYSKNITSV